MTAWGGMREVLRDGQTEGRVALDDVLGPTTFAVGALEGLAGEITVIGEFAYLAQVDGAGELSLRQVRPGDQATLLVAAQVESWSKHELPKIENLGGLESKVAELAAAQGIDVSQPFVFRVRGRATELRLHVLNHSCPIADPSGPAPWRHAGADEELQLVGFHATDAAGTLTHHGQSSHVHAVVTESGFSGHVDGVGLEEGAQLLLPSQ